MNKKKKKGTIKKILASFIALVLVVGLTIVGTLAYLATLSNEKHNTFTGSKGISLQLTEPLWDANGNGIADDGDGMKAAGNYSPGNTIAKDPTLTNNTNGDATATEWVAIAVSYKIANDDATPTYKEISYENMKKLISPISFYDATAATIAGDASKYWIPIYVTTASSTGEITVGNAPLTDNGQTDEQAFAIYLYNKTLAKDESTPALFNQVQIKGSTDLATGLTALSGTLGYKLDDDTDDDTDFLNNEYSVNGNLPGFKIDVIGAAIKNEYNTNGANSTTLATEITELSDANKLQLISDLVEVLEPQIDENVRKVGGS